MYTYSSENAKVYSQLGIRGTTYEVSFNAVGELLEHLEVRSAVDFGTGTGRSARFLKAMGVEKVIGVDHNETMIEQARASNTEAIEYALLTDGIIPLAADVADAVVSMHVFVEMTTLSEMQRAAREMARVLRPGGTCIIVTTNPAAVGSDFKSYSYSKVGDALKSGDAITCTIKGEKPFEIRDIYWTEEDYRGVLIAAGFTGIQAAYPLARGEGWLDERNVAPDLLLTCVKPGGTPGQDTGLTGRARTG